MWPNGYGTRTDPDTTGIVRVPSWFGPSSIKGVSSPEINKFFTDTLILSLVGSDKNEKIDEAYNYNQVNTDYVLSGINF